MKTEVRKEHGDWIVFVDDNPQFSFMYEEEADKVRNMVDVLIEFVSYHTVQTTSDMNRYKSAKQALKDIGAI